MFVIRNSFSISVSEKTKQYGMMASVGATSKQIRKSVLFEGLIIGLIGIPLGILLGTVAIAVLVWLLNVLLGDMLMGIEFVYGLPIQVVLISVIMSAVTIYLSCLIPAWRASKISPIDAIRGKNDIKIKSKKLRTSKLTKKIFGMGGVIASKNLKRSKKKYRTTVISLVVSISTFIALSSFLGYGKKMTGVYYTDLGYNIQVTVHADDNNSKDKIDVYNDIIRNYGLNDYSYSYSYGANVDASKYCTEYGKSLAKEEADTIKGEVSNDEYEKQKKAMPIQIIGIEKGSFERYAKSLGLKENFDNVAILNDVSVQIDENKVRSFKNIYNIIDGDNITFSSEGENTINGERTINVTKRTDKKPVGYENMYTTGGYLFASEDSSIITKNEYVTPLYINSDNSIELETKLNDLQKQDSKYSTMYIDNIDSYKQQEERMILVISIFLYGFIIVITLIGVTNIFNTITTNMILRSKEFAMLKSVGMTGKEFNKMIRLESILYGLKSLVIGIPIGLLISYAIYKTLAQNTDFGFIIPWQAILISIVFVFIIVGLTMKYSLNKINKQNIVETIRNDNI